MPSKRKQIKKLKRDIKRRVQRSKTAKKLEEEKQQQQQEMMNKLMMFMNGNRPAANNTDPAAFLMHREATAKAETDAAKQKRAAKEAELRAKAADRVNRNEHEARVAQHKTDEAQRQAEHNAEMMDLQEQQQGVKGPVADLKRRVDDAKARINKNKATVDMEDLQHEQGKLEHVLQDLQNNINYKQMDMGVKTLYADAVAQLGKFKGKLQEFNELLTKHDEVKIEDDQARELRDSYYASEAKLIQLIKATQFKIDQYKMSTAARNKDVEKYLKMQEHLKDLEHQLTAAKAENETAGRVYDRDENGNIVEVVTEEELEEISPDDDPEVKRIKSDMHQRTSWLNSQKLYLCDIICHGVPSPTVFKDYIDWLGDAEKGRITKYYA